MNRFLQQSAFQKRRVVTGSKISGRYLLAVALLSLIMLLFSGTATASLLEDGEFSNITDSNDLRNNGNGQDWYESRGGDETLLTLDATNVSGNESQKAKLTGSTSGNAYLSQEFATAQTGQFSVQWDIWVEEIPDSTDADRSAYMMIGDDTDGDEGPNSSGDDRFVSMAFYRDGDTDTMTLVARQPGDEWSGGSLTPLAADLNLGEWYTIKLDIDVENDIYDVYVNEAIIGVSISAHASKSSLTHISFASLNEGPGTFYVDNVTAIGESPQAQFSATPSAGLPPLGVSFTDSSSGDISSWSWAFGDGGTSTLQHPTHVYNIPGDYTITLTVSGPAGDSLAEKSVEVQGIEISNDNDGDDFHVVGEWPSSTKITGYSGENYLYNTAGQGNDTATWSFDITQAGTYKVFAYWSAPWSSRPSNAPYTINHAFGSTTVRADQRVNGGQWNELGEFYFEKGAYSVVLSDDADGNVVADAVRLVFQNAQMPAPDADFSADVQTGQSPLTVRFSEVCQGEITDWEWDFGDGNTSTEPSPTHTYENPGVYTVTLTGTGPGGASEETKSEYVQVSDFEIIVDNQDADFDTNGSWPTSAKVIGYYADGYQYNEAGQGYDSATWNFTLPKAGTYRVYGWWSTPWSGRPSNAPYTIRHLLGNTTVLADQRVNGNQWTELGEFYFDDDAYSVTLTDDADGSVVADAIRVVLVREESLPPHADFSADNCLGLSPLAVQFTDKSSGDITEWHWDFGDGSDSDMSDPSHVYENDGFYTVTLTVSNGGSTGHSEMKTDYIKVYESVMVIDNKNDNFQAVGDWPESTYYPGFWKDDYQYNDADGGNDRAIWNVRINRPGTYRVSAWWSSYENRPSDAPYTVSHSWGETLVRMDQRANGSQWNELGRFYFEEGDYSVVLTDDADGSAVADAIRFAFLHIDPPGLEVDFSANQRSGESGLTVQFNDLCVGDVSAWNWEFGDGGTSNAKNPSHTYTANGLYTVTLTASSGDDTQSETKKEYVIVSDVEIIRDNRDAGFQKTGDWPSSTKVAGYYGSDYQYNASGQGNDKAIWDIAIPETGTYRVYGWWSTPWDNRPSNAPYTIDHFFGSSNVRMDQRKNGSQWNELGEFYFEAGDTCSVTLSDDADGSVVADAIRLLLTGTEPPPPQADFSSDIQLGTPPMEVQFIDQSIGNVRTWHWDFGDDNFSSDPNPTHVYDYPGAYTVTLTVSGTDAPATTLKAEAADTETKQSYITASDVEIIVDNSAPEFDSIGSWPGSTKVPGYYGDEYLYNAAGGGNDKAIWNFTTDKAGSYKIYGWWSTPWDGRPSNAPYTVDHFFGSTTVRMNQKINGSQWNEIGEFYFEKGDFSVVLSDDANGSVVADAVRILFAGDQPPPPEADFSSDIRRGEGPLTVQFTDQSSGFVTDWYWDFGDGEVSYAQHPMHTYSEMGIYTVRLEVSDDYGSDIRIREYYVIVEDPENTEPIFVFFGYSGASEWRIANTVSAIEGLGAIRVGDLWIHMDRSKGKMYQIQIIDDFEGYEKWGEALMTENAHIIYDGHSNYGSGHVFASQSEHNLQSISAVRYIDDERILNFSSKYFSLPISAYQEHQAYPNWEPVFQDGTSGVMPYTFDDPNFPGDPDNPGVPAYNYYLTYQVPGDPTHYKVNTMRYGPIERFPGAGPAWYSPDGDAPDPQNPEHRKYFITKSDGKSDIRAHYSSRTILFRRDMPVPQEEFRYKRLFVRSCYSGSYYIGTYHQGIMFFTHATTDSTTYHYLKAYLQGKSDDGILAVLQNVEAKYDYYNFNELPPEREPTFEMEWDIYVDEILDLSRDPDRGGLMFIGNAENNTGSPNRSDSNKFVYLAFHKDGGGDSGTMDLVARSRHDSWDSFSVIAEDLSLDQWYTIRVACDLISDTYDVYVDDKLVGDDISSRSALDTVTHITFAQWDDGAGTFYVDNVRSVMPTYDLIADGEFDESIDSQDLREDDADQDWYESRKDEPTLVTLDANDIGGNDTVKAKFKGSRSGNVYLSQEIYPPQTP